MRLTIDFDIGPIKNRHSVKGQYIFIVPDNDKDLDKHINNALAQSIKKLKCDKEKIIVGVLDVFVNEQKYLKMSFFKIGSLFKNYIKK
jgi:hypothetical protein